MYFNPAIESSPPYESEIADSTTLLNNNNNNNQQQQLSKHFCGKHLCEYKTICPATL